MDDGVKGLWMIEKNSIIKTSVLMNETEILCNENDPNLQSWCKRLFGSKKSNRIIMFILIQKCSHLSIVFGSSRPVGSCFYNTTKNVNLIDLFTVKLCPLTIW